MLNQFFIIQDNQLQKSCWGYCASCRKEHSLAEGLARQHCLELMKTLDEKKRIDLALPDKEANPRYSTEYLYGKARGQMFGVMVYRKPDGFISALKAFSGQYDGVWEVKGWAPPLFDVHAFNTISHDVEKRIKQLGRQIDKLDVASPDKKKLTRQRKNLSQHLMKDIHSLYRLTNFQGETRSLYDVFTGANGIPTGTGDCCAPKLLNFAAKNDLRPLGLAEFYWGRENRLGSRMHGRFYPSCEGKCQPILGFLLCGLESYE